jgi:hypothetical protein
MALSKKVREQIQLMDEWYVGLDVQAKRIDPNATIDTLLGPPTYNHKDLMKLASRGVNINIRHTGLRDIAPDLDDQSSFVLNSLKDGMDGLRTAIYELYELLDSFARETGPVKNITKQTSTWDILNIKSPGKFSKLQEEYNELLTSVSMNAVSVYTSQGRIQNAISMLQMQAAISDKVIKYGEKMGKRKNYIHLSTLLKATLKEVQQLQQLLEKLKLEIRKIKAPRGKNYPKMKTSGGTVRVDKLYYDVLIEFLRVVSQCHKVQANSLAIEKGIREIARASDIMRKIDFIKPSEVSEDKLRRVFTVYRHINSQAVFLDGYEKLENKKYPRFLAAPTFVDMDAERAERALAKRTQRLSSAYIDYNSALIESLEKVF